jgi:hypothetical protein
MPPRIIPRLVLIASLCFITHRANAADVFWTSDVSGNWSDPANWSSNPRLPGGFDHIIIERPNANPVVTATNLTLLTHQITSTESIVFNGGTTSLGRGESTTSGRFTLRENADFSVANEGTSFVATGTTIVEGANLTAINGASLSLPNLSVFTAHPSQANRINANGGGSIDLSGLEILQGGPFPGQSLRIEATYGGSIKLAGELQRNNSFLVTRHDSEIDLSGVTAFNNNVWIDLREGGKLHLPPNPNAHTLRSIVLRGEGSQLTGLENAQSFRDVDLVVEAGAILELPSVQLITPVEWGRRYSSSGAGSVLDLSSLQRFDGQDPRTIHNHISAVDGGTVRLGGSIEGSFFLAANGASSVFDATNVTALREDIILEASNGGRLSFPNVQDFREVRQIYARGPGSTVDLSNVSLLADIQLFAQDGGELSLPEGAVVTTAPSFGSNYTQSEGIGSHIDLSLAARIEDNRFKAMDGGRIDLGGVLDGSNYLTVIDANSQIDLSEVTGIEGYFSLTGEAGAQLALPPLPSYEAIRAIRAEGSGGGGDFPGIESLQLVELRATFGATLRFPDLKAVHGTLSGNRTFHSGGPGSLLDVSNLELTRTNPSSNMLSTYAGGGGRIEFGDIVGGRMRMEAYDGTIAARDVMLNGFDRKLELEAAGTLELTGDLILERGHLNLLASEGIIAFLGNSIQTMEIAGEDRGPQSSPEFEEGNFGLGKLVVGSDDRAARVHLVDHIDNYNRIGGQPEALYLYGLNGEDGLSISTGSVLYFGSENGPLSVYTMHEGQMILLDDLIHELLHIVHYGDGFISNTFPGDLDFDDTLGAGDLDELIEAVDEGSTDPLHDVNFDGEVTAEDVRFVLDQLGSEFGDANLDGHVDLADLNQVRNNFGNRGGWTNGNFDADGIIGLSDLNTVRNLFGHAPPATPVPEPSSLALLAITCAAATSIRRRFATPH